MNGENHCIIFKRLASWKHLGKALEFYVILERRIPASNPRLQPMQGFLRQNFLNIAKLSIIFPLPLFFFFKFPQIQTHWSTE